MKDSAFKYLQFCTKQKLTIGNESAKKFDSNLNDDQLSLLVSESSGMLVDILMKGGIIYDKSIFSFENITDYLEHIHTKILDRKNLELNNWIQNRPARKFFTDRKPKNKTEELLFDKMEESTTIIEEYWDNEYFNEKELATQLICICERDYGGENRIGILIKKEAYAHQYRVIVRGIVGPYNVSNEGNGWELELEEGAQRFTLSKTYKNFPTKDELIDDFVCLDILESQPPIDYIRNDLGTLPIYPTAKEYFK
jgi:hypothetical protein